MTTNGRNGQSADNFSGWFGASRAVCLLRAARLKVRLRPLGARNRTWDSQGPCQDQKGLIPPFATTLKRFTLRGSDVYCGPHWHAQHAQCRSVRLIPQRRLILRAE